MMIRVTGSQLHAARALACLTRQELAERAGLSYHSIRAWERSSNSIPEATYDHLCRAVKALEAAGVRFSDGGVPPVCQSGVQIIEREVIVDREVFLDLRECGYLCRRRALFCSCGAPFLFSGKGCARTRCGQPALIECHGLRNPR